MTPLQRRQAIAAIVNDPVRTRAEVIGRIAGMTLAQADASYGIVGPVLGLDDAVHRVPMAAEVAEAGPFATAGRDPVELQRGHALGKVNTPRRVWDILHTPLAKESQEVFLVIPLDLHGQALSRPVEVARGQRDRVNVNEADILRPVHTTNAKGFIMVHNHPSLHASPSPKDKEHMKHIRDRCKGASFQFLDHIIIASSGTTGEYYSFTEDKLTKVQG
jgi:hypothetical protein